MSEPFWMILIGVLLFPVAALGFKKPELFMHGRRSGHWMRLIGEEKTKKFIRFFSVPLILLIAVFLILAGLCGIFM